MIRKHVVKDNGNSVYELIWECLGQTAYLSCEHIEFSVNGKHYAGWYAFGYAAAEARYNELCSIIGIIP